MDHYQRRDNNYQTVDKDGRKLAVINADDLEDGLIIVNGNIESCELGQSKVDMHT